MTKSETGKLLYLLQTAYPRYYDGKTADELAGAVDLWFDLLADHDTTLVFAATKELIRTLKFPPTIADITEKMYNMTNQEEDDMELWNELDQAVRRSIYNTQQVFDGLSPLVKKFVGNPAQLRDYAMGDAATFNTVTKGQFLKQIPILKQREKELKTMLPESRRLLESLTLDASKLLE
jgi:hypothetical protein